MTFLKRILTTLVIFVLLFAVLYMAICIIGGAIVGARAGMSNPNSPDISELGREAGGNFVRQNIRFIVLGSAAISLPVALALSFSGIFLWCRKPKSQPDLEN